MGARYFARRRIEEMRDGRPVGVVARPESPSPATGSSTVHDAEQNALLEAAIRPADVPAGRAADDEAQRAR